jgi:hypothetical protein
LIPFINRLMKLAKKPVAISSMDSKTDPDQFDQFFHFAENSRLEFKKIQNLRNLKIVKSKKPSGKQKPYSLLLKPTECRNRMIYYRKLVGKLEKPAV